MAQVKEVSSEGLKREFVVTVPLSEVETHLTAQLQEISKTAKIPGFRPGKIPMEEVRRRYGQGARAEALDKTVSEATQKTLTERNLRPAMQPQIELISMGEGKDVEFKLQLEVLPEIKVGDFKSISVERKMADVDEKEITETIERGLKSMRKPEEVTGRAAKLGDVLTISYDGTVDGVARDGMKSESAPLELGSKSFIDTFEEQLVGSKVGDKKSIKVKFPENYGSAELSGKDAVFAVEVKAIAEYKAAEQNDEAAKELGFDSIEKLRERVKTDIAANYGQATRVVLKRELMDKLADMHKFDVPQGMLEAEFNGIWERVQQEKERGGLSPEDAKKSEDELRKEYRAIADRRIRLGLLLAEVARAQNIQVEPNEMRNALMEQARNFPGQEKAVIDYYTQTQGALEPLRAQILEDKVIDYIATQAKVGEKKISADELMKLPQEMDA